jgi:hypothetical protein
LAHEAPCGCILVNGSMAIIAIIQSKEVVNHAHLSLRNVVESSFVVSFLNEAVHSLSNEVVYSSKIV